MFVELFYSPKTTLEKQRCYKSLAEQRIFRLRPVLGCSEKVSKRWTIFCETNHQCQAREMSISNVLKRVPKNEIHQIQIEQSLWCEKHFAIGWSQSKVEMLVFRMIPKFTARFSFLLLIFAGMEKGDSTWRFGHRVSLFDFGKIALSPRDFIGST